MTQGVIQDETHLRGGNGKEIDDKEKKCLSRKKARCMYTWELCELYCIDNLRSSISATRLKTWLEKTQAQQQLETQNYRSTYFLKIGFREFFRAQ